MPCHITIIISCCTTMRRHDSRNIWVQMRLDNAPMGVRRGGKLPMKDLVKAANGNIDGLKHLLKTEWELPEDTRVAVYGIDCDGAEFEFTPMVADDLLGMLQAC